MKHHQIKLEGPGATGTVVGVRMLRAILAVLVEGSQEALRLRTQGRSRAPGAAPRWIGASTDFRVEIWEGSTVLAVEAPSLFEADHEQFGQGEFFPEIDPERSSLDYLADAAEAALAGEGQTELYDAGLLKTLGKLGHVFETGIESIGLFREPGEARPVRITVHALAGFRRLEASIPPPRRVRAAGFLETIRHSDRTFVLQMPTEGKAVRGGAREEHLDSLQALWGKRVLVSGLGHFTADGTIQRIEAEGIQPASQHDIESWGLPVAVTVPGPPSNLRVYQGRRSGLAAILGKWPGDEAEETIAEALERLS